MNSHTNKITQQARRIMDQLHHLGRSVNQLKLLAVLRRETHEQEIARLKRRISKLEAERSIRTLAR